MEEIRVNTKNKINTISPILYGAFFEDINYGGDGGLYAELIANRSFEYYDRDGKTDKRKMCWETIGNAEFEIKSDTPLNDVHKNYALVSGKSGSGIRNTGYGGEGFAVRDTEKFNLSFYASSERAVLISVYVRSGNGEICGAAEVNVTSDEWRKYEREIIVTGSAENAYLEIVLGQPGTLKLEFISLFPADTFHGHRNGFRRDIAEMIANMKPKFLRFPGGCVVEGRSFENMYNWKDTIGPVEERRTNYNRWQMEEYQSLGYDASDYFQSYGIGFFEYFQFCEDIGAKPVPVVNCGMTCQWHEALLVETDKLDPYIQDVIDLIEFANGDGTGEWSRIRVEMGHKEPFDLEYIGIGNEQWGTEYFERYELFQKEIARQYPGIKLITSAGWKDKGREFELAYDWMRKNKDKAYAVDEHFYKEPEWFLNNIDRYDGYDRSLPKVFIGEWAAHTSRDLKEKRCNWYCALAEAAFLTGVERNADHVVMASYAPLLARINHNQWQPNLIWFNNSSVYGIPGYYVQKLFAENVGDTAVETQCTDGELKISASTAGNKLFVKIVNVSESDKTVRLLADCEITSVSAEELYAKLDDENTLDMPLKVSPKAVTSSDGIFEIKKYGVMVIAAETRLK